MAEVIWTEPALADVSDIAEYIALDNELAAKKLVQKIFEKVERLEQFPNSGKSPSELKGLGYKEVLVNPCRVIYKCQQETVYILHVLRQERSLRKYIIENNE